MSKSDTPAVISDDGKWVTIDGVKHRVTDVEAFVTICKLQEQLAAKERTIQDLLTRIQNYDRVIQAVATALGGVCCGGIDVDGPGSTKEVLVSAIENLKSDLKLCRIRRGNDIAEFNERLGKLHQPKE